MKPPRPAPVLPHRFIGYDKHGYRQRGRPKGAQPGRAPATARGPPMLARALVRFVTRATEQGVLTVTQRDGRCVHWISLDRWASGFVPAGTRKQVRCRFRPYERVIVQLGGS